jgi:hypothetical protein
MQRFNTATAEKWEISEILSFSHISATEIFLAIAMVFLMFGAIPKQYQLLITVIHIHPGTAQ